MIEAITISTFVVVCLLATLRSSWALALLVVLFPLKQALQASSGFFLTYYALPNYIAVVVTLISVLRKIAPQHTPLQGYLTGPFWCTIVLFTWSIVSLLWTPSVGSGSDYIITNVPYFLLYVVLAPLLMRGMNAYREFLLVLLIISTLVAIVILVNPVFTSYSGRIGIQLASNIRTNPLAIGELGGVLMITAALFRDNNRSILTTFIRITGFIAGVLLALQSGSRGQVLFAVVLSLVFFPISRRVRSVGTFVGTAVGVVVICAVVLFLAQYILEGYALRRWDASAIDDGVDVRFDNLVDLIRFWTISPLAWLIGLGFNAFTSLGATQAEMGYTHNIPVDVLTELGIPMFGVFVGISVGVVRSSRWLFARFGGDTEYRAAAATAMALAAYQFLLINKQGMLWTSPAYFMWSLLLVKMQRFEAKDMTSERSASQDEISDERIA
jgi:hypothetical protein